MLNTKGGRLSLLAPLLLLLLAAAAAIASAAAEADSAPERAGSEQQLVGGRLARLKRQLAKKRSKQLELECLNAHNKYRRLHKVPELQWDDKLAAFAQKRSKHIADSDGAAFGHPPDLPYGENLFWHSRAETACELMVRGWYDEIKLYNFKRASFAPETGHFTQLIWRDTKRVGCATAQSSGPRGGVFLTCSYDPAGNFVGEFGENVPPARAGDASGARDSASGGSTSTTTTTKKPTTTTTTAAAAAATTELSSSPSAGAERRPTTKPKSTRKKGNKNKKKSNKKKKTKEEDKKPGNKKQNKGKKKRKRTSTTTSAPSGAPAAAAAAAN